MNLALGYGTQHGEKEEKEQGGDRRSAEGAHVFLGMSTMESYKGKSGNMNEFGNG